MWPRATSRGKSPETPRFHHARETPAHPRRWILIGSNPADRCLAGRVQADSQPCSSQQRGSSEAPAAYHRQIGRASWRGGQVGTPAEFRQSHDQFGGGFGLVHSAAAWRAFSGCAVSPPEKALWRMACFSSARLFSFFWQTSSTRPTSAATLSSFDTINLCS